MMVASPTEMGKWVDTIINNFISHAQKRCKDAVVFDGFSETSPTKHPEPKSPCRPTPKALWSDPCRKNSTLVIHMWNA